MEGKDDLKHVTDNYVFLYTELVGRVSLDLFLFCLFDETIKIINSKKLLQIL